MVVPSISVGSAAAARELPQNEGLITLGSDQYSFLKLSLRHRKVVPSGLRRPRKRYETDIHGEFLDISDVVFLRKTCLSLQISSHGGSERSFQLRESCVEVLETSHLRAESVWKCSGQNMRILRFHKIMCRFPNPAMMRMDIELISDRRVSEVTRDYFAVPRRKFHKGILVGSRSD